MPFFLRLFGFGDSGVLGALRVPPLILNLWNADGPFSLKSVAKPSDFAIISLDWALRIIFLFDLLTVVSPLPFIRWFQPSE